MPPPMTTGMPPAIGGARIMRLFGIDVVLHWSWILSAVVLAFFAHAEVVGGVAPFASREVGWLIATGFAFAIHACILAHELAHCMIARAYGLPVRQITMFALGGVSMIAREAPSPRAEFSVSVAGPMASVLIAVGTGAVMRALNPSIEGLIGAWGFFAMINMLLALFNLIPAFPMDGGRILRSVLWAGRRDRAGATRWAAGVGKAFGLAFAGIGFVLFALSAGQGGSYADGVWFAFIGLWLFDAAGRAGRSEGGARPNPSARSLIHPGARLRDPGSDEDRLP